MPECASIFILPPSVAELEKRLRGRATDSDAVIARRLADSLEDLTHWADFDFALVNDDLNQATAALQKIIAGAGDASRTTTEAVKSIAKQLLN